jgi:hypothetical protein
MLAQLLRRVTRGGRAALQSLAHRLAAVTKPKAPAPLTGALADLVHSKPELVAENAMLRQQHLLLRRSVKRPPLHPDRPRCWSCSPAACARGDRPS